jgi:hypothetical protein
MSFALDSAYFCRDLIEAADTIQKMKTSSGSVIRSLAEMQTSALNLHQKTAGGYIRPFAATTGTIRDADLRPQPSPEDGWRLHSTIRHNNRYNQRCRPPPSTFTRRRLAATFDHSPPQQVQSPDDAETIRIPSFSRHLASIVGIMNDITLIYLHYAVRRQL